MFWCDNPKSKFYNKQVIATKGVKSEKLFRKDIKYNYFIVINYNTKKIKKIKEVQFFYI